MIQRWVHSIRKVLHNLQNILHISHVFIALLSFLNSILRPKKYAEAIVL